MLLLENSLERVPKRYGKKLGYLYKFKCVNCPKEILVQKGAFKRHSGKCKSCAIKGEEYKFIYTELKKTKNHKHKEFTLTFEEFKIIISNNFCHYCGRELIFHKHSRDWGKNLTRAYQLDRKDNSIGYTFENSIPCCWTCNRLKSDIFTYNEFILLSPTLKDIRLQREVNL